MTDLQRGKTLIEYFKFSLSPKWHKYECSGVGRYEIKAVTFKPSHKLLCKRCLNLHLRAHKD